MASKADTSPDTGSTKGPQVMRRPASVVTDDHGVKVCRELFQDQFGWLFRDPDQRDGYGIDGWVEVVGSNVLDDEHVTGRMIAVQIKGGSSFFDGKETDAGWRSTPTLPIWTTGSGTRSRCWSSSSRRGGDAYWQLVINDTITDDTTNEFKRGLRIAIPRTNKPDVDAKDAIAAVAWTKVGLSSPYGATTHFCRRMPSGRSSGRKPSTFSQSHA